jgi:hypothetical protein
MKKARSRLAKDIEPSENTPTSVQFPNFIEQYKKYLPTLGLGLVSWALFYLLLTRIYPQTVQHWFIPHVYLPVLAVFFFAVFFTTAFVLLNTRRGFLIGGAATSFLFLKLQQIEITFEVVSAILIFFGILELSFVLINFGLGDALKSLTKSKQTSRADIRQKIKQRKRN